MMTPIQQQRNKKSLKRISSTKHTELMVSFLFSCNFSSWFVRQIIDAFVSYIMVLNNKNTRFIKINMIFVYFINPLSPKSDQHQFSPRTISIHDQKKRL